MSPASGRTEPRDYPADGGLTGAALLSQQNGVHLCPHACSQDPAGARGSQRGACALGLHGEGSSDRIFNLEHCFLQSPQSPAMVQEVRRWCGASGLAAYNPKSQRGFWRFLVLREGKRTGQTLVHLITTDQGDPAAVDALAANLKARFPSITTLVHSRRRTKGPDSQRRVQPHPLGTGIY